MYTVSIVGTAGRDDNPRYDIALFDKMINTAKHLLKNFDDFVLVSGGAAWADHIAVRLFLEGRASHLVLHLPAEFIEGKFNDNGVFSSSRNPGKTANYYHRKFQSLTGVNSLDEIKLAIEKGAEIHTHDGFMKRNTFVAMSDFLIAFTWGNDQPPNKGGTRDTWNKCVGRKYHISLTQLY